MDNFKSKINIIHNQISNFINLNNIDDIEYNKILRDIEILYSTIKYTEIKENDKINLLAELDNDKFELQSFYNKLKKSNINNGSKMLYNSLIKLEESEQIATKTIETLHNNNVKLGEMNKKNEKMNTELNKSNGLLNKMNGFFRKIF